MKGSGDGVCSLITRGGFQVDVSTPHGKVAGPRITATISAARSTGSASPSRSIRVYTAADIDALHFKSHGSDGLYLLGIGNAFIVKPRGDNGAVVEYVSRGRQRVNVFLDENVTSCQKGSDGPHRNSFPCVGRSHMVRPQRGVPAYTWIE